MSKPQDIKPPIPLPEAPPPCDAIPLQYRSRGRFIATGILLAIGSGAAVVGSQMFKVRARDATSSVDAVALAGNWAGLGIGGGFLLMCAVPVLLWALVLWWRER